MFENYGHIHVYSPRVGADNPPGHFSFKKNVIFMLIWSFAIAAS